MLSNADNKEYNILSIIKIWNVIESTSSKKFTGRLVGSGGDERGNHGYTRISFSIYRRGVLSIE